MISILVGIVIVIFLIAYIFYGRFLAGKVALNNNLPTPACRINDGIDYVPAKHTLLLGQHFSAIAAAGPIVGPVLACLWFGWLPALIWIVLGAIFIGGTHDFFALVASIRHDGASIGEVVKKYMPGRSYKFFLIFVWFALIYVVIAFTDITAHTFKTTIEGASFGPAVAASSVLYLFLAMAMGLALYKFKVKLLYATTIFLPLMLFVVWSGPHLPETVLKAFSVFSVKQWDVIILFYCLVASLIPVWLLLQPRGFLGGWFLYLVIAIGLAGALFGGFKIEFPALNLNGIASAVNGKNIFPLLFITVACGACSGFHGIVSSGTTSNQLKNESDSVVIAYGAMLLEGLVAVLAIATVMMLPKTSNILKSEPNLIYAHGIASYLGLIKIPYEVAFAFALLAFSTFVYDTLDVCTRLARYCLQELMGWSSKKGMYLAGVISVMVPFLFLMTTKEKGYLVAWPIFGTSNQLLASFILLAVSVWLMHMGKKVYHVFPPMIFMFVVTIWSLVGLIIPFVKSLSAAGKIAPSSDIFISGMCGICLLGLSAMLIWEARKVFRLEKPLRN
ncbi:MAG: carbon starvation CstA family protein, partial [Candidatus Omnitrophota bacterium]